MKKCIGMFLVMIIVMTNIAFAYGENFNPEELESGDSDIVLELPSVASQAYVVMDAKTGYVLAERNMDERHSPASTTKVMTVLLALELAENDYEQRIVMSDNAIFGIDRSSSHIAMDVDESLSLDQALHAILVGSANEVSMAVAEHFGGTVEKYAEMMTKRAEELGAIHTSYVNPHGLQDANHYITAYDEAIIFREALKHEFFRDIIQVKQYIIPPTEKQPENRIINNTNALIKPGELYYEYSLGGKTGYTDEARHLLVSLAEKDGVELIVACVRGEKNEPFADSVKLFEYGFSLYKPQDLMRAADFSGMHTISVNSEEAITFTSKIYNDISIYLPNTIDVADIVYEEAIFDDLDASSSVGDICGELYFLLGDTVLHTREMYISEIEIIPVTAEDLPIETDNTEAMLSELAEPASEDSPKAKSFNPWLIGLLFIATVVVVFIIIRYIQFTRYDRRKIYRFESKRRFRR